MPGNPPACSQAGKAWERKIGCCVDHRLASVPTHTLCVGVDPQRGHRVDIRIRERHDRNRVHPDKSSIGYRNGYPHALRRSRDRFPGEPRLSRRIADRRSRRPAAAVGSGSLSLVRRNLARRRAHRRSGRARRWHPSRRDRGRIHSLYLAPVPGHYRWNLAVAFCRAHCLAPRRERRSSHARAAAHRVQSRIEPCAPKLDHVLGRSRCGRRRTRAASL